MVVDGEALFLGVPEQLEAAFAQHRGIGDVNAGFIGGAANGFRHAVWIAVARVWSSRATSMARLAKRLVSPMLFKYSTQPSPR